MSIEIYKQLNEELIKKVQELKINVSELERENINANARAFDEREKRIECEQKFLYYVRKMSKVCKSAASEIECDKVYTPTGKSRSLAAIRRSSMGVTVRSPLRSNNSPQQSPFNNEPQPHPPLIVEETTNNESSGGDADGDAGGEESNANNVQAKKAWELSNIPESSENSLASSCQSNNTFIKNNNVENNVNNRKRLNIPTINITNRRATQMWDRNALHAVSPRSPIEVVTPKTTATATLSPNVCEINSNTMDRLTADFSQNVCLHSTPQQIDTQNLNTDENETLTTSTLSASTSRPKRQCAPKNLVEPNLNTKIRNEEKKDKKRHTKKKKK